ncbi:hypothetical protein [Curtobacterium sp. SORGH_AS_0776]|uniref:DUF7255 family protein n=1 Tax=Curtobacterium sp. SORGH_AS_0776 TaxID=3041798 RepID=UPI002854219D|nr:hypothetical protein [Curtobacterium sp. SORGH_AS_0776]MDR6171149.1 hypothetical protein [Curtobacterium sp. SORGH_AS_0776]
MPKTGARVSALDRMLQHAGLASRPAKRGPRLPELPEGARSAIRGLYRQLGGVLDEPKLRPGGWDLAYDGILVELDEEMHFNRYRAVTLDVDTGASAPWAAAYEDFCRTHERRSGTGGRRWSSPSAERMFGAAAPHWTFEGGGAPRWKQRALYDAMKDVAATAGVVRLSRISVYDMVDGVRLEDLLRGRAVAPPSVVRTFVESRALGVNR